MKRNHIWGLLFILAGALLGYSSYIRISNDSASNSAYQAGQWAGGMLIPGLLMVAGVLRILKASKDKKE
jgi:hypothetical protein